MRRHALYSDNSAVIDVNRNPIFLLWEHNENGGKAAGFCVGRQRRGKRRVICHEIIGGATTKPTPIAIETLRLTMWTTSKGNNHPSMTSGRAFRRAHRQQIARFTSLPPIGGNESSTVTTCHNVQDAWPHCHLTDGIPNCRKEEGCL